MISAEAAQQIILDSARPLETEEVPLVDAVGRYLATPVIARIALPPFDHAAMDGFAIRSGDTAGASQEKPASLQVIGTIAAGSAPSALTLNEFKDRKSPLPLTGEGPGVRGKGQAVRIMTGAPIPAGADAVVPFESCTVLEKTCLLMAPVPSGNDLRRRGEDVAEGEELLRAGAQVTSRVVALLAALGEAMIGVVRTPCITLLGTGSELTELGQKLGPGKIYNSNVPALQAALREIGLHEAETLTSSDDAGELQVKIEKGLRGDVLITSGGVSAGDFDRVPAILKQLGAEILFHKVAVKPGKPLLFARRGRCLIFGLPGNPVSSLTIFERFVRPALRKLMGDRHPLPVFRRAVAAEPLRGTAGREDFLRGVVTRNGEGWSARSAGAQSSASLKPLAGSNALLILPATRERIDTGEELEFTFLGGER